MRGLQRAMNPIRQRLALMFGRAVVPCTTVAIGPGEESRIEVI